MNIEYRSVPTSAEVVAVIMARHPELRVFGSHSAPEADHDGRGRMFTSYGFDGDEVPVLAMENKWDIDREKPHKRLNEEFWYWLCVGQPNA